MLRSESWPGVKKKLLAAADLIVIDCRDSLLYKIAGHFLLFPWTRRPLVAVDLVLPLREAIARAWEDNALRQRTAESGRRYAASLGGEPELLQRIFRQALSALAVPGKVS